MDEMKLKLSTPILRRIVAKIISKQINKKLGTDVSIELNDLTIRYENGKANLSFDASCDLDANEFKKIISSIGLED